MLFDCISQCSSSQVFSYSGQLSQQQLHLCKASWGYNHTRSQGGPKSHLLDTFKAICTALPRQAGNRKLLGFVWLLLERAEPGEGHGQGLGQVLGRRAGQPRWDREGRKGMGRTALAGLAEGFVPPAMPTLGRDKGLCIIPVLLSERESKALSGGAEREKLCQEHLSDARLWAQNPSAGWTRGHCAGASPGEPASLSQSHHRKQFSSQLLSQIRS